MTYSGQPIKRLEDHRLLTGQSSYVDDLKLPGMLHASVLRSPHAHATIKSIDTAAATSMAGVVSVVTAAELTGAVRNVPTRGSTDADELKPPEHPVLAGDKVCYVGQPVAIVVAENSYLSHDAMELVQVDYEPLPSVVDPWGAMATDAPPIHQELGTNIAVNAGGDLDSAFAQAEHVVRQRYQVQRVAPAPMEPRGVLADYQSQGDLLTVWDSTQHPHEMREHIARLLDRPEDSVRVIAPDAFPYETPTGITYDSGNYEEGLDRVLESSDYHHWKEQAQQRLPSGDALIGVGLATVVKGSGARVIRLTDHARVMVDASGRITAHTGVSPHGQGTETTFSQVAAAAYDEEPLPPGVEPGLDFTGTHSLPASPYAFGAHVAVVEVSRETGHITILKYAAVHDAGRIINPMLADGQVQGGIAQGIGQALVEGMIYSEGGQPLTGSLMDYALPRAANTPDFALGTIETPSPVTPLGVKGIGELPTLAAPVAVANAVMDALAPLGIRHIDTPLTPEKIWGALQEAKQ